jgi:putative colanic acid biosynthesis glycosyltransferase
MKVIMINSVSGYGSTGSICVDIAKELESQGHECFIAHGQITKGYNSGYKIGTFLENHLHNLGSRISGKQGYYTRRGTKKLVKFIENHNPDVIHLHNLHGNYLNLQILFEYFIKVQKPVVWTLHDCWAFTGKCAHYTDVKCYKWQTHCNNCPQIQKYPPSLLLDRSDKMFDDKKKWFTSLKNLTIIPVSKWLASEVKKSFLNKYPIIPIYNWVNYDVFQPVENNDFFTQYELSPKRFTVLVVSAGWRKTDVKWKDALLLSSMLPNEIQFLMIGNVEERKLLPKNIKHIDYLHSNRELAKAYSFSDVYVHLSTEDTFGKVIAEALSCGTPAIVYDTTACPEIIDSNCGYVVERRNLQQVLDAINKIKKNTKAYYSTNCRKRVLEKFDDTTNIKQTIGVYIDTLKR